MVDFGSENRIEWSYDLTGAILRKTVYEAGIISDTSDYLGGIEYINGELDFVATEEGRAVKQLNGSFDYVYDMVDHLGNVRVSFNSDGQNHPVMMQKDAYYPFGMRLAHLSEDDGNDNKYLYNGKELEEEHNINWYHYGARFYDPQLGRWHTRDSADEFFSPYVYCHNDPVNFLDPEGNVEDTYKIISYLILREISLITKKYVENKVDQKLAPYKEKVNEIKEKVSPVIEAQKEIIVNAIDEAIPEGIGVSIDNIFCVQVERVTTKDGETNTYISVGVTTTMAGFSIYAINTNAITSADYYGTFITLGVSVPVFVPYAGITVSHALGVNDSGQLTGVTATNVGIYGGMPGLSLSRTTFGNWSQLLRDLESKNGE